MIRFTDDCLIGIEMIDNEHRRLFELIDKGMEMLEEEEYVDKYDQVKELIDELEDYADVHFEHEEKYMNDIRDPELINQRVQHNMFRERVRNWSVANIDSAEAQRQVTIDLMKYMTKWLYNHIIGSDTMIGKMPPVEEWMLKEHPCEFSEEYATGIALVDAEHRELFKIIGQAYELVKLGVVESDMDEIEKILKRLEDYTKEHFGDEEEYMESIGYEGLEAQKRAHAAFINKLDTLDFEKIKQKPQENMEALIEFLMQWLINHIMYTDKKIPIVQ
jgi:hemerythrin